MIYSSMRIHKASKRIFSYIIKVAIGIIFIMPLIFAVCYSVKPESLITVTPPSFITQTPTLEHFRWVLVNLPFLNYIRNSFMVCFISIVFQVIFASLAAYAFAFFDFKGKSLFFTFAITAMMIPADIVIVINYATIQKLGLVDTYLGLAAPTLISGTSIFMMRQYYLRNCT